MSIPRVSIVIPVHNTEKYIHQCLDSLVNQIFDNFQLIIVDDGSTDNSGSICDEYAINDNRITVIHTTNQKTLIARKEGVKRAVGEYICFIDADDFLTSKSSLGEMVELAEKSQVDIVQFNIDVCDANKSKTISRDSGWYETVEVQIKGAKNILKDCFYFNNHRWFLWNKIYRTYVVKKAFENIEPVSMKTAEDAYIYFLIAYFSGSFLTVKTKPFYSHRIDSGITSGNLIGLDKFELYCKEINLIGLIKGFLNKTGENEDKFNLEIGNIKKTLFKNIIMRYGQLNVDNLKDGVWMFRKYCKSVLISDILGVSNFSNKVKIFIYGFLNFLAKNKNEKYLRKYYKARLFDSVFK